MCVDTPQRWKQPRVRRMLKDKVRWITHADQAEAVAAKAILWVDALYGEKVAKQVGNLGRQRRGTIAQELHQAELVTVTKKKKRTVRSATTMTAVAPRLTNPTASSVKRCAANCTAMASMSVVGLLQLLQWRRACSNTSCILTLRVQTGEFIVIVGSSDGSKAASVLFNSINTMNTKKRWMLVSCS